MRGSCAWQGLMERSLTWSSGFASTFGAPFLQPNSGEKGTLGTLILKTLHLGVADSNRRNPQQDQGFWGFWV